MLTGSLTVAIRPYGPLLCGLPFGEDWPKKVIWRIRSGRRTKAYKREVPRFFPKLSLYKEADVLSVRASMLYKTFFDGLVFFIAYPLLEFVEYLQVNPRAAGVCCGFTV